MLNRHYTENPPDRVNECNRLLSSIVTVSVFTNSKEKTNMKTIVLFASISIASGLMFANVYTSMVDAKSWGSDIPGSIAAAREYFKTVSPANFFRILSPSNQVLALAVLVLFWKSSSPIRMCLAAALVLYVLTDVMTFAYFYPRNEIMFSAAAQRCNTSQGNLGFVERDELGALFDPACGSDSILCVVAQDLFDRRIVLSVGEKGDLF